MLFGLILTAVGAIILATTFTVCEPVQPLAVLVTVTTQFVLTVGLTETEELVAPVLQLQVNEDEVGVGAVTIVAVVTLQFTELLVVALGMIAALSADNIYEAV